MDLVLLVGGAICAYLLWKIWQAVAEARRPPPPPDVWHVGELTEHSLAFYCGADWAKPTLIAVQGVLYDVTKAPQLYGRRECLLARRRANWARAGCSPSRALRRRRAVP